MNIESKLKNIGGKLFPYLLTGALTFSFNYSLYKNFNNAYAAEIEWREVKPEEKREIEEEIKKGKKLEEKIELNKYEIKAGVGAWPIKLNDTYESVIASLGEPDDTTMEEKEPEGWLVCYRPEKEWLKGIIVHFDTGIKSKARVISISVGVTEYYTKKGIKINQSTMKDIISLYGEPEKKVDAPHAPYCLYIYGGIDFSSDGNCSTGFVNSIFVSKPKEKKKEAEEKSKIEIPQKGGYEIQRGVGISQIKLNDAYDSIIKKLGNPKKEEETVGALVGRDCCLVSFFEDMRITFDSLNKSKAKVDRIEVSKKGDYTKEGIEIGKSTIGDVILVYGKPDYYSGCISDDTDIIIVYETPRTIFGSEPCKTKREKLANEMDLLIETIAVQIDIRED